MTTSKYIRAIDRTVEGGSMLEADFDYKRVRNSGTGFSEEIALKLLEHIATGKSLRSFCIGADGKTLHGRPSVMAVMRWKAQIPRFNELYEKAKLDRADSLVDEMVDIADNEPDPKKARVMVETRKWVASKFMPRVYGDRVAVTGATDGAPIQVESVTHLSDADLMAIAQRGRKGG